MNRAGWVLAIVFAALVVSAQPVSAAHVAAFDSRTTDTELSTGTLSGDVSVTGTGASASVTLDDLTIDSFEDDDLSEYTGSTADWGTTITDTTDGTIKLQSTASPPSRIVSTPGGGLPRYYDADTGNLSVDVKLNGTKRADVLFNAADIDNSYIVRITPGGLDVYEWDGGTRFGVAATGNLAASVPTNEYVNVQIDDDGSVATVTLYNEDTGAYIADASFNKDDNGDGIGFDANATGVFFDDARLESPDTGAVSGSYVSANYSVERVEDGWTNLTLSDADATVTWEGTNGNTWTEVASTTYSTTGNRTLDLSGQPYDTWRVNVTLANTGPNPTAELHDEGIRWRSRTPNVDDANASPTGSVTGAITLSIPVTDGDFPTAQGDSVDVEFFTREDGATSFSSEGTDTLTSNGTASVADSAAVGETEWYAIATDSEGNSIQSETFTYTTPGEINIYNETSPNQLINDREVTATIHVDNGSDTVVQKRTSNGTVPLGSIPTDQPLTVVLNTTGYYNTTYRFPDAYGNYSAFMLNSTIATYDVRFTLVDRTGQFPRDNTTVLVQRPLNQSGSIAYRTTTSDVFGAGGTVKTKLKQDQRYRIVIRNRDGDTRILGPYVADRSELVELEVGVLRFSQGQTDGYEAEASYRPEANGPDVLFNYSDPANQTDQLRVIITNRSSGQVVFNQSFNNVNSLQITEARPQNDTASYKVEWRGTRDGVAINGSQIVGPNRSPGIPLDPLWKETFAVILILIVGGGSVGLDPAIGAIGTGAMAGLMWFIGWLDPLVGGGIVFVALAVGVMYLARPGGAPAP